MNYDEIIADALGRKYEKRIRPHLLLSCQKWNDFKQLCLRLNKNPAEVLEFLMHDLCQKVNKKRGKCNGIFYSTVNVEISSSLRAPLVRQHTETVDLFDKRHYKCNILPTRMIWAIRFGADIERLRSLQIYVPEQTFVIAGTYSENEGDRARSFNLHAHVDRFSVSVVLPLLIDNDGLFEPIQPKNLRYVLGEWILEF